MLKVSSLLVSSVTIPKEILAQIYKTMIFVTSHEAHSRAAPQTEATFGCECTLFMRKVYRSIYLHLVFPSLLLLSLC